jgi:sec-independent protein translocase protein TatA
LWGYLLSIASAQKISTMGRLGLPEILIIAAVFLLLFGGKKIPELMKGLGTGIKEFKNAAKEEKPAEKKEETKE